VVLCMVVPMHKGLPEMKKTPDVIVTEMMLNGDLVFIRLLAVNGNVAIPASERTKKPIIRGGCGEAESDLLQGVEPVPSDLEAERAYC
jgi:hypothetical protein